MPPHNAQSLTSSLTPSGHHMRRGCVAANPGQGGIEKKGRLPNQHSLRDLFLRAETEAKASKGRDIPSQAEVEAEKVGSPPTASAKWAEYLETQRRAARTTRVSVKP